MSSAAAELRALASRIEILADELEREPIEAVTGVDLGPEIRRLRKTRRLSQEQLGKRVGLSRTSVTNIERGRQHVNLEMARLFMAALGVKRWIIDLENSGK